MTVSSNSTFILNASADELKINAFISSPEEKPKAVVQFVHGMSEHKERYFEFMKFLAGEGYASVIHDHRGHGETVIDKDDLGYFYDGGWKAMVEDIGIVGKFARSSFPGIPLILFGHSMGSMAVRSFAKRHDSDIDGLIVCGSPSENKAALFGKMLAGTIGLAAGWRHRPDIIQHLSFGAFNRKFRNEGSPNAWICSDKDVVREYDNDTLCGFTFTANGFYNLLSLMSDTYSPKGWKTSNPDMPVLFISGSEDPCLVNETKFLKAVKTMENAGYRNIRHILYKGMRHEILNETGKEAVWHDISEFVRTCINNQ